jgi:hypothetical protein
MMKQKRTKPRPTRTKGERWPATREDRATAEYLDWIHDVKEREYKKSAKYKEGQDLAEKFKSKNV